MTSIDGVTDENKPEFNVESVFLRAAEKLPEFIEWTCERVTTPDGNPIVVKLHRPTYRQYAPAVSAAINQEQVSLAKISEELVAKCMVVPSLKNTELRNAVSKKLKKPIITDLDVLNFLFTVGEIVIMGDMLLESVDLGVGGLEKRVSKAKN